MGLQAGTLRASMPDGMRRSVRTVRKRLVGAPTQRLFIEHAADTRHADYASQPAPFNLPFTRGRCRLAAFQPDWSCRSPSAA